LCYVGVNCMNPLAMKDEKTHGHIVLSCRLSCRIFMIKNESIRWKKEKFFSGYIVLLKPKIAKKPAKGVS
ncbi:hypothetical protein PRIPAC_84472, partial [Pristionchus pacificus]